MEIMNCIIKSVVKRLTVNSIVLNVVELIGLYMKANSSQHMSEG